MKNFKNKKILYIGQSFFGYESEIKLMLEKLGAYVDYYNERPNNNFWTKALIRLKLKKIINFKIKRYYLDLLTKIKVINYDYVFIIKIETIDEGILLKLKENQKKAKFILYLWDSIKNYKGQEKLLCYFDKSFSFDPDDTILYGKLKFLPLFYAPIRKKESSFVYKYDLCFIGTGHSDRYEIIKKIETEADKLGLQVFKYLYLQSKLIFLFRKIFSKRMHKAKIIDFNFVPLSKNKIADIISNSKVVIDIEHPKQAGLTMRTIEMIGAEKKILTTNKNIQNYDFYNENNIHVFDRNKVNLNIDFFNKKYKSLPKKTYENYSLENWLKKIFFTD